MASANTKFERFLQSLIDWLSADATLISLTGYHSTTKPQAIQMRVGNGTVEMGTLAVSHVVTASVIEDVENGIWETTLNVNSYSKEGSIVAMEIVSRVQEMCDNKDGEASFTGTEVQTVMVTSRGLSFDVPTGDEQDETSESQVRLVIRWRDLSTT